MRQYPTGRRARRERGIFPSATPPDPTRQPASVNVGDEHGKTVTKPFGLKLLELPLSEKQIPQVVERFEVEVNLKKLWRRSNCAQGSAALTSDSHPVPRRGGIGFRNHNLQLCWQIPRKFASPHAIAYNVARSGRPAREAAIGRQSERVNPLLFICARTVSEGHLFQPRRLLIERKQIPQIVVIAGTSRKPMAPLEITRLPWAQGVGRSNRPAPTN